MLLERKKKFFGAVFIDAIGTPLTMIIGIVLTPVVFRYISTAEFGYWTTVLELMTLLTLLNSGIGYYIIQTVTGESENGLLTTRKIVSSLVIIQLAILIFMMLMFIVLYYALPSFKQLENNSTVITTVYKIMSANLILSSISSFLSFVLQGQNKVIHTNFFTLINKISIQILPVSFLFLGFGLVSFPIAHLSINSLLLIAYSALTYKYLKQRVSISSATRKELKSISRFSIRTFLGGTSYYVLNFTDAIVIANFLSNTSVTIYILTMKLGNFLRFIPARVITVGMPVISQLINEKQYIRLQDLTLKFFRFSLRFGIFASCCIFFLNEVFVIHWVGVDKFGGRLLTLLSAFICLRESIFPIFSSIIFLTKSVKWMNYIFLFEALLNMAMSLIFVNIWGIIGVAFATVLSFSIFSVMFAVYKTSTIIRLPIYRYLPSFLKVLIRSAPSIIILWIANYFLSTHFSWYLFMGLLLFSCIVNILCFEGLSIASYRFLTFKQIVLKIIDEA